MATLSSVTASEGMIVERRGRVVAALPEQVFAEVERLGGDAGWPSANVLWRIRVLVDGLVGGVGMRLGRRDPDHLRVGDALDFWRVEELRRPSLLRLRAEMKVPGRAWLRYEVTATEGGSRLVQTAFFEPKGLPGLVYWYALYPVHGLIFRGTVRVLADRADAMMTQRFSIHLGRRSRLVLMLFGVRPSNAYVDLADDELDAHFGFFRFRTPTSNLASWRIEGPWRWITAIGVRFSIRQHDLTFGGTNSGRRSGRLQGTSLPAGRPRPGRLSDSGGHRRLRRRPGRAQAPGR